MDPLIESKRQELERLCRKRHVRRLDLFGSATGGDFDPHGSDLDFVVIFEDEAEGGFGGDYFQLIQDLESLFHRPVDLIEHGAIRNPYLLREIEQTRVPLYAA